MWRTPNQIGAVLDRCHDGQSQSRITDADALGRNARAPRPTKSDDLTKAAPEGRSATANLSAAPGAISIAYGAARFTTVTVKATCASEDEPRCASPSAVPALRDVMKGVPLRQPL